MKLVKLMLLKVIVGTLLFATAGLTSAKTLNVPLEYSAIQAAIDAAGVGDTVQIAAGTYYEHLYVAKALTISGEGQTNTILDGQNSSGNLIHIVSDDVTIRGLWFRATEKTIFENNLCILISRSQNCTIELNTFSGSDGGIYLETSHSNTLRNNVIYNNGVGIFLWLSNNNKILNNTIDGNNPDNLWGGINISYSDDNIITNNISTNNKFGINCYNSTDTSISYNDVWNNSTDYQGCKAGTGDISMNPLFVDAKGHDFHLQTESPCIDAGDSLSNDSDGSRNDMGAYGGTGPGDSPPSTRSLVENFVSRFYQLCLDRNPDPAGLDGWLTALLDGSKTGSDVAYGFVFSDEYINKNTTDEEFLQLLYEAFFNRQPDEAGRQGWLDAMQTGASREDVLNGFIFAVEFAQLCDEYGILAFKPPGNPKELVEDFVTRFYQLCLGRNPDPAGLNGWATALLDGSQTGSDVAHGFVFSQEFINKNTTNEAYLTVLYEAFFNRQPDSAGWQGWMDALINGSSREAVLNGFIFATEFIELCDEYKIIPYDPLKRDDDGDGFTEFMGDCNDSNQNIHPGAVEVCGDGIDQDCNGSDLVCQNNWIVGDWKVAHVEGPPPGVTYTGSWRFKSNDTYEFSFYSPGYYDIKGGGNYNLSGNTLFVDGIIAEGFDYPQGISIPLTVSQDRNTFQFRDDEGDQWTLVRVQ